MKRGAATSSETDGGGGACSRPSSPPSAPDPSKGASYEVGQQFVATDNEAAAKALELGRVPRPLLYVTLAGVFPDARKVTVLDGQRWLTFAELEECFRRV